MKRKTIANYDNSIDGNQLKKIKKLMIELEEDNEEEVEIETTKNMSRTHVVEPVDSDSDSDKSESDNDLDLNEDDCEAMNEEDSNALQKFLNPEIAKDIIVGMKEAKEEVSQNLGIDNVPQDFDWDSIDIVTLKRLTVNYKKGRVFPKFIKVLPQISNWCYIMEQLDFPSWSIAAVKLITEQFLAKGGKGVEIYYKHFLLPYIRNNIAEKKRLDNVLYKTLQNALFRRREFMSCILLPWCDDCITGKEAEILGNILKEATVKLDVAGPAMTTLMNDIPFSREILMILKSFLEKKYNIAFETINCFVDFFYKAATEDYVKKIYTDAGKMPILWFQLLNLFASLYYRNLSSANVTKLNKLCKIHFHDKITPSIRAFLKMSPADKEEKMEMSD